MKLDEVIERATAYLKNAGLNEAQINTLRAMGYFSAPASKGHHLACAGGLALHSINVVDSLLGLGAFHDAQDCYLVGMLHDLCKTQNYFFDEKGKIFWNNSIFPGHGAMSVFLAQRNLELGQRLSFEHIAAITWHMGAFALTDSERDSYKKAVELFPRAVILTHAADYLSSVAEDRLQEEVVP